MLSSYIPPQPIIMKWLCSPHISSVHQVCICPSCKTPTPFSQCLAGIILIPKGVSLARVPWSPSGKESPSTTLCCRVSQGLELSSCSRSSDQGARVLVKEERKPLCLITASPNLALSNWKCEFNSVLIFAGIAFLVTVGWRIQHTTCY